VTLTNDWDYYTIDIAADLNTTGVAVAFTVKFEAAGSVGPTDLYVADITYIE
jgi:hypothetical protein